MSINTIFQSSTIQPHWMMGHTINFLGAYYMKLSMLESMEKLYADGANDSDFIIATRSFDLYSTVPKESEIYNIENYDDFVFLESKARDAKSFWKKFHNLQRPIIMCRNAQGMYKPIYVDKQALSFTKIELNSPHKYHLNGKKVLAILAEGIIVYGLNTSLDTIFGQDRQIININQEIDIHNEQPNQIDLLNAQDEIRYNQRQLQEMIRGQEENNREMLQEIREFRQDTERRQQPFIQNEQEMLMKKFNYKLHKVPLMVNDLNIG